MSHPAVRARINRRVTGDETLWPIQWLRTIVPDRVPFRRTVSVGCGVGNLERSLSELGLVHEVVGIDESAEAILEASRAAAREGHSQTIRYDRAEARDYLSGQRDLDAVFFHASLHHFDRLAELLGLVRDALAPGGVLYCDEYVGPSRHEWRWHDLLRWNRVYLGLPASVRRARVVRAPVNREDPTEAVASSEIGPAITGALRMLARKDYGGNLLPVIYPPASRGGRLPVSCGFRSRRRGDPRSRGDASALRAGFSCRHHRGAALSGPRATAGIPSGSGSPSSRRSRSRWRSTSASRPRRARSS